MTEIIGVRFRKAGKVYYFDPCGNTVQAGDHVIVETARGIEYGEVILPNHEVDSEKITQPLKNMIRIATPKDDERVEKNRRLEEDAFRICQQKIAEHKLDMKLIEVEYTFDNNKLLFYFSADVRIDFRELVKDLAYVFKTRIELRQIGVRDESKMIGGLGVCGRPFCCASFLDDFQPVSIKMAKDQGLSLNPTKISGTCGRLMCCLKYEQGAYEELLKQTPKVGAQVNTPKGTGTAEDVSLLRGKVKVRLDSAPDAAPEVFDAKDLQTLRARGQQEPRAPKEQESSEPETAEPGDAEGGDRPKNRNRPNRRPNRERPQNGAAPGGVQPDRQEKQESAAGRQQSPNKVRDPNRIQEQVKDQNKEQNQEQSKGKNQGRSRSGSRRGRRRSGSAPDAQQSAPAARKEAAAAAPETPEQQ